MLVQAGLILAGLVAVTAGWANYAAVTIAPLYVILLMIAESRNADTRLEDRHGSEQAFREYRAQSGSLLPRF